MSTLVDQRSIVVALETVTTNRWVPFCRGTPIDWTIVRDSFTTLLSHPNAEPKSLNCLSPWSCDWTRSGRGQRSKDKIEAKWARVCLMEKARKRQEAATGKRSLLWVQRVDEEGNQRWWKKEEEGKSTQGSASSQRRTGIEVSPYPFILSFRSYQRILSSRLSTFRPFPPQLATLCLYSFAFPLDPNPTDSPGKTQRGDTMDRAGERWKWWARLKE